MRTKIGIIAILSGMLLTAPVVSRAEDGKGGNENNITGQIELTGEVASGKKESAKFDEYKDTPNGAVGGIQLNYRDMDTGDHFSLDSSRIALEDQRTDISGGRYGKYKIEFRYDETPHRFAYGVQSLYAGGGSENLTLPAGMQSQLQGAASSDVVNKLNNTFLPAAQDYNLQILRKKGAVKLAYTDLKPFTFKAEVSHEERTGSRPLMGSFGFSNVQELIEPIDYLTTNARFSGEYLSKDFYASLGYYLSVFQNDKGNLTFSNPFRVTDGSSSAEGPSKGRIDLAPDNIFHGPSVTASLMNLPMKSRLTFNGSWGFMSQDDSLLPYTSNTSIIGGEPGHTFNASDVANLPTDNAGASVNTQLYNLLYTSKPTDYMDVKAKYRYYDYNNTSKDINFPGSVTFDSTWQAGDLTTTPVSYSKQSAGTDVGFKVLDKTRLGLGYQWDGTHRSNREVASQDDNTLSASVDRKFADWVNVKTSYEKSFRRIGEYNFKAPFGDEAQPAQLPLLRKYDEADRDMDKVNFLGTVTPIEDLSLAGSFMFGQSQYDNSIFGLKDDRFYVLSGDVDYALTNRFTVGTFYSYEQHNSRQNERQWTSGGPGDPYTVDTGVNSNSNWSAMNEDVVHTVGMNFTYTLVPKVVFFDLSYAYSDAHGRVDFSSILGTSANDANAFTPTAFDTADRTIVQRVNPRLRYKFNKSWDLIAGYLWEKFNFNDFTGDGYTAVPLNSTGGLNGAILAGSWPYKDYEVNLGYVTVRYKF